MSKRRKIIVILCTIVALVMIAFYLFLSLETYDTFFYNIITHFKSDSMTNTLKVITTIGDIVGTIILMIIVIIINRKRGIYFAINIGVISLLNFLLKNIFMRERPIDINLINETGYSFPSGHTMTAVAAYGLLLYYLYNSNIKHSLKVIGMVAISLILVLIPLSRVYLGVHFFSDITLGSMISIIWLMFYTNYLKKHNI